MAAVANYVERKTPDSEIEEKKHEASRVLWDESADSWVKVAHLDKFKAEVNTPIFLEALSRAIPDIRGKRGLDIGCGTGPVTRKVAVDLGAKMMGMDCCKRFVDFCKEVEKTCATGNEYFQGDATAIEISDGEMDFAISIHCMMDIPEVEKAMQEAHRVIKSGGAFAFSIPHPCFWTKHISWIVNENGEKQSLTVADYFENSADVNQWMFEGVDAAKEKVIPFKTLYCRKTLKDWSQIIRRAGFFIEEMEEPRPTEEFLKQNPDWRGCGIVPYSLIFVCRKV